MLRSKTLHGMVTQIPQLSIRDMSKINARWRKVMKRAENEYKRPNTKPTRLTDQRWAKNYKYKPLRKPHVKSRL
ncbi:unnamed protein product [Absidia cylindrospora]